MNVKDYQKKYREEHKDKIREEHKRIQAKKRQEGFCTACGYGVPVVPGKTLCEKHLLARRGRRRKLYEDNLLNKRCTSCGKPALPGKKSCEKCLIDGCKGVRQRAERGKRRVVEYLGGKCRRCGLVTDIMPVYEIHHLTKRTKEFNIKTIRGWSWESIKRELDKGVELLCANCHRIVQHAYSESWANRGDET